MKPVSAHLLGANLTQFPCVKPLSTHGLHRETRECRMNVKMHKLPDDCTKCTKSCVTKAQMCIITFEGQQWVASRPHEEDNIYNP